MAGPAKKFGELGEKGKPAVVAGYLNSAMGNHFVVVAQDGDTKNLTAANLRIQYPVERNGEKVTLGSDKITGVRVGAVGETGSKSDFEIDYLDGKGRPGTLSHSASANKFEIRGAQRIPLQKLASAADFPGGEYPNEKTDKLNRIPVMLAAGLEQAGVTHNLKCDVRTEYRSKMNCPKPGAQ